MPAAMTTVRPSRFIITAAVALVPPVVPPAVLLWVIAAPLVAESATLLLSAAVAKLAYERCARTTSSLGTKALGHGPAACRASACGGWEEDAHCDQEDKEAGTCSRK